MNLKRSHLVTISVFARSARVSVKALRLYDNLSILKPAYTDPDSGYRYYHIEQVHTARLIRMMRLTDMPLAMIREVLDAPQEEAEQRIRQHQEEMRRRLALAEDVVQTLIHTLKGEIHTMTLDVTVKTRAAQNIISMTHHIKVNQLDDTIRDSVKNLQAIAAANNIDAGTPFGMYHGSIDHESDGPIEVCLPVDAPITEPGEAVQARELPAGQVASVELRGKECIFPDVLKGYDAIQDWLRQNGYKHTESPYEIWHSSSDVEHLEITWAFAE